MSLASKLVLWFPQLKRKLYMAGSTMSPEEYISQKLRLSAYMAILLGVFSFFIIDKNDGNPLLILFFFIFSFIIIFWVLIKQVDARISRRGKEIDRDVLFAGRFLLVKLNSGRPLVNALSDATKSYGVSKEYFKQIVKNIDMGTPLEIALEQGTTNCPSEKLRKILFQITSALKIGTNVTDFLDAILDEIAEQQLIEIQRYGKKLNSLTMFYMLFAIVMPSLGMTMLVVIISFVNIAVSMSTFILVLVILMFIQFMFMTMFRSVRPNVHL